MPPAVEIDPDVAEPPLLTFVRDYWERKRGTRAMPSRIDISPADMKTQLRHILLADVAGYGEDFKYRLVGSELHRYFAGNPTGQRMSEILAPFGQETVERTLGIYRDVIRRRAPLRIRGSGRLFNQNAKLFDALLTPLSDNGEKVNMIFGTFTFEWDKTNEFTPLRSREIEESELASALQKGA